MTAASAPARSTAMDANIDKGKLQAVIRRAAELYAAESDPHELLSETEVVRIGEELGLPARLVRQALYELPDDRARRATAGWLDQIYGTALANCSRVVPGDTGTVFDRLEEYLTTREYLQPRRRQGDTGLFEPAGDAISTMARALVRPAGRYHVARASSVILTVRPIEPGTTHVRLTINLSDRRRSVIIVSLIGGGTLGIVVGTGIFALIATIGPSFSFTPLLAGVGGLAGFGLTLAGTISASASRFRRALQRARFEVAGLLDRLQRGDRLDPPSAPWWRRMRRLPRT